MAENPQNYRKLKGAFGPLDKITYENAQIKSYGPYHGFVRKFILYFYDLKTKSPKELNFHILRLGR